MTLYSSCVVLRIVTAVVLVLLQLLIITTSSFLLATPINGSISEQEVGGRSEITENGVHGWRGGENGRLWLQWASSVPPFLGLLWLQIHCNFIFNTTSLEKLVM